MIEDAGTRPSPYRRAVAPPRRENYAAGEALPSPRWRRTRALLALTDLLAVNAAGASALLLWSWLMPQTDAGIFVQLAPLTLGFLAGYYLTGLYPAAGVGPVDELRRLTVVTTILYGTGVAALFLAGEASRYSRGTFLLAFLATLLLVPVARAIVRHLCAHRRWFGVPAVLLGAGKTAEDVLSALDGKPGLAIKVVACFDDDPAKVGTRVRDVPVLGPLSLAAGFGRDARVRTAIVAMPGLRPDVLATIVRRNASIFSNLVVVPDLFGLASTGAEARDLAGIVGLNVRQNLLLRRNRWTKRALDLALMVPAALVALPVVALGALGVFLVDRGNPFYAQQREGRGRRTIRVWKLRTMYRDGDEILHRHLSGEPAAKAEWERHFKLAYDPRVLPLVGDLLRRSSIDELPQLWNILRGEMSFVGPRPFPYYHIEQFDEEFRDLRAEVTPGLTGWWQVESRSTADLSAQQRLDGHYIRNWSLWMDVYLLARTPWAVSFGKGAY